MKAIEQALSETAIIQKVLAGETALYELIVRRFNATLYKIGRSYNYDHEDTQDLMQDTYVDAFKSLAQFEGKASFKTWIARIMMNNCFRKRQKLSFKNEIAMEAKADSKPLFTGNEQYTDKALHNKELGHIIENALEQLPSDYRMVFSLREINGMNIAETADLLAISEANVKVRLNRAKAMLRTKLQNAYSPKELYEFNLVYCDSMVEKVMKRIYDL